MTDPGIPVPVRPIHLRKKRQNAYYINAAEFQVLALFIKYPDLDPLKVSLYDFPHEEARALYQAICNLKDRGEILTESALFREANFISDKIDVGVVKVLFEYDVDRSNYEEALKTLHEESIKYKVKQQLFKLQELLDSHDPLNKSAAGNLLYRAQEILYTEGSFTTQAKTVEQCFELYKEELKVREENKYHYFYDPFLDTHLTRKASPGQVILIAGATGAGKSIFALNLVNGMLNTDTPCLYFSLEMDTISTFDRLLALRTGIPIEQWYGENIAPLYAKVDQEKELLKNKPFRFIDDPDISIYDIRAIVREFKATYRASYVCVFIDLITQVKEFMYSYQKDRTLANTIELAINQINALAKKENCCVVAIAQMNREADNFRIDSPEEVEKFRPTINHVKNSHALGERARVVLSIFRPKYYIERLFPDATEAQLYTEDILQVQILKQSQGAVGQVGKYLFDGTRFLLKPYVDILEEEKPPETSPLLTY